MKNKKTIAGTDADISLAERNLLDQSIENSITKDSQNLERSKLDNVDEEGTPLNEKSSADDLSGDDLDIPGSELDDEDESMGNEDEENNNYSRADTE